MRGPLPPPSATGVRIAGDRFQWLVAWEACVTALLDLPTAADNPIVGIGVEVDGVGNVDDVAILRSRPPHTYKQVKYAVDSTTPVNTAYLTDQSSTGGPSILAKIATAWRALHVTGEPVELAIVTNRQADPGDLLVAGRDSRTRLLVPKAGAGGPLSARGRARVRWATAAGLNEPELLHLLDVLQFDLGHDPDHLEQLVSLEMRVAGLRGDTAAVSSGIDFVVEQVIAGRREITLNTIKEAIEARGLRVDSARSIVSIATLLPDPLANHALYAIDWVDRFEGEDANLKRRPKPPATWVELQADIQAIPSQLGSVKRIVVTGSMRLAPAFAVGAALRMVTGVDVAAVQRGELWRSEAPYATPATPAVTERAIDQGDDLAIAIEVSAPIADDVTAWIRDRALPVKRLVVLGSASGPRDNAVAGADEACALAVGIRNAVRQQVKGHSRIHLFIAAPMALALLLGHRWNRVAPTVVYEDLGALGYEAAFSVNS
jgi:hypothetical protein